MEKFKQFCNILIGKNDMDQIMGAWDGENKNKIYNSIATQNDNFYIFFHLVPNANIIHYIQSPNLNAGYKCPTPCPVTFFDH